MPHGTQQCFQMVLRRPPDPADIPPDAARLLDRRAEMDLLDEWTVGMGDEKPETRVAPDKAAHCRGGELAGAIVRMALAAIFESHRQDQRKTRSGAGCGERAHVRS